MRAACMDCPHAEAPYAEAEAAFAQATAYLSSRDAQHMSESDLERELHRRGQELMRTLLQGHLEQRSPGEAAGPVEGADGVERAERRVHERHLETIFGTVQVERLGYASPGHDSLRPLDAALNLPPERYSLEVRRRVAQAAASRSFDDALFDLARTTGAAVPKRQAEALVVRAAQDFDAFYEARREADGPPLPEGAVAVRGPRGRPPRELGPDDRERNTEDQAVSGHLSNLPRPYTNVAISGLPKGRKYLISQSFLGKVSVRPAQVGGVDVNTFLSELNSGPRTCPLGLGGMMACD